MGKLDIAEVDSLRQASSFLSYVFTVLPTREFVEAMSQAGAGEPEDGQLARIAESLLAYGGPDAALLEVSKDRARLLRALSKEGPTPPYESSYISVEMATLYGDLFAFYRKADLSLAPEYRERPDFIGTELALFERLAGKLLEAADVEDGSAVEHFEGLLAEFFKRHMEPWMPKAAHVMAQQAETAFYREVGAMLESFIEVGREMLVP